MSFIISGLPSDEFAPLFGLPDAELAARGVIRKTVDAKPGYPCRITLEDAEPGESVLLLNHVSHTVATPYRSAYAIYVREHARKQGVFAQELPPVFRRRPIALRLFNSDGMLVGADIGLDDAVRNKILQAFDDPQVAYIHAHNAMHGCFAAEVRRL